MISENKDKKACCSRLKAECQLSMFSLMDTTGQTVDLKQTLAPKPWTIYGLIKVCIFIWNLQYAIYDSVKYRNGAYWFIFLTNWGILLTFLSISLTLFGFVKTIYLERQHSNQHHQQSQVDEDTVNTHTFFTRCMSTVGILAMNLEILIILVYWVTIYNGGAVTFQDLQVHGLLGFFSLIDILVIHRIPIRFKQIFLVYAFSITYLIWTLIHSVSSIGHYYNDNNPETDDDSIYPTVNWNKRPGAAAVMAGSLLLVVTPIIFFTLWFLSTLLQPRYCITPARSLETEDAEQVES